MSVAEQDLREAPCALYIDGSWTAPGSGGAVPSTDPSTEREWAQVPEGCAADVDAAVAAARAALSGEWARMTPTGRGTLLGRLADEISTDADRLARLESRDNGKPLKDTRGEMERAASWLRYYAGAADKIHGEAIPLGVGQVAYTKREPVGVVAAITPWNSPVYMYAWKLGPALAAGNAVILKPAEEASVTALELAAIVHRVGFPPGVVNVVTGYGRVVGTALSRHPDVNKVAFTGHHVTAQNIMREAAGTLKRLTLECGGKGPHIVFADADLERAARVVTASAFRSTGQSCTLGSRLFLQREIHDAFLDRVTGLAQGIRVGDPFDGDTDIGPQTTAAQLEKTMEYIGIGREEAGLVLGGGRPLEPGFYIEPTIFRDVDPQARIAQEEIFGPVLSVIPFDEEDDVLSMANDVRYGLVGGVWTKDVGRAHRMVDELKCGFVSVNTYRPVHWSLPYGGLKLSGFGRENGLAALHEYTETKTVVIDVSG